MRLPLQGGLPPAEALAGAVVEIACDESGFSGTNLLHAATPVITHASVDLGVGEAAELIAALRSGFGCSLSELKSGQFLRGPGAAEALDRFLAALAGRAHVQLVDKEFFLVTRIVDLFLAEPSYGSGTRLTQDDRPALEAFFRARDALPADAVLAGLHPDRVWDVLTRMTDGDLSIPPPLEPMLPALAETVLFWSGGQRRVLVVHDEQSALTAGRLRRLQEALAAGTGLSPLAGLVSVDSRDDPRVQVADLLAGVARRTTDDGPLRPFVSPTSLRDPARR